MSLPISIIPVVFTVQQSPGFLQSSGNPMLVKAKKTPHKIGEMFFLEIWTLDNKFLNYPSAPKYQTRLYRTLQMNGPGDGTCTFDISAVLATKFRSDNYDVPNPALVFQRDQSGYVGYYLKMGYLTYNAKNQQVRNYKWESDVCYALRAKLPSSESGDMSDYFYKFDGETHRFLTAIPDGATRRPSEATYLPFVHAQFPNHAESKITVLADLHFSSGAPQQGYVLYTHLLNSGGVFLVNVAPQSLIAHPNYAYITRYSVYIRYEYETYNDDTGEDEQREEIITQSREFLVGTDVQQHQSLQFMNRFGGWDALQLRRDTETEIKAKSNGFTTSAGSRTYQVQAQTQVTYHSSWLNQDEFIWLKDLIMTPALYINGRYQQQADVSYKLDSSVGLFTLDITVSPDTDETGITL